MTARTSLVPSLLAAGCSAVGASQLVESVCLLTHKGTEDRRDPGCHANAGFGVGLAGGLRDAARGWDRGGGSERNRRRAVKTNLSLAIQKDTAAYRTCGVVVGFYQNVR